MARRSERHKTPVLDPIGRHRRRCNTPDRETPTHPGCPGSLNHHTSANHSRAAPIPSLRALDRIALCALAQGSVRPSLQSAKDLDVAVAVNTNARRGPGRCGGAHPRQRILETLLSDSSTLCTFLITLILPTRAGRARGIVDRGPITPLDSGAKSPPPHGSPR